MNFLQKRLELHLSLLLLISLQTVAWGQRNVQSFDRQWRFLKDDCKNGESADFDDSQWRVLDVPHDWSIEGPFDVKNPAGPAGAYLPTGVGWYRKHFSLPAEDVGRRVFIQFDGVMANSDVWINGFHLGHRPFGYVSIEYELTGHLQYGAKENVIAVRADNSNQPASRWYAGAGIYRHVRLIETSSIHFADWSTFITTPTINADYAIVHVHSTVVNQSNDPADVQVQTIILRSVSPVASGSSPSKTVPPNSTVDFDEDITVSHPFLWSPENPYIYHAVCNIVVNGKTVDQEITDFGIRTAEFKSDSGFWLNGTNIKLKGVCLHGDMGGLGTAVPMDAWRHRLEALKLMGCNAIRTSHNPVAPEFLDLCDEMGFLVMDEFFDCWTIGKNPYDYHLYFSDWALKDLADSVRRDRNHPCIILYSAGNEIRDTRNAKSAKATLASLVAAFHANDPTRPVTQAILRPNVTHDYDDGFADLLDVVGTNYRDSELLAAHEAKPSRKIVGTENAKDLKAWLAVRDNGEYSGQFLWVGADYLGEGKKWPELGKENGLLTLTDEYRPIAFQRQSWWSSEPVVSIARDGGVVPTGNPPGEPQTRPVQFRDWMPANAKPHNENVLVYSNCHKVELILNGKSLGSQDRPKDDSPRKWEVPFAAGTIEAFGSNNGEVVAKDELRTPGKAAKIILVADKSHIAADWDGVCFVRASITDEKGTVEPGADDLISFDISAPGVIAAVENDDRMSHEPFQAKQHKAFGGECVAIIKATEAGEITLTAHVAGLPEASIAIDAEQREAK